MRISALQQLSPLPPTLRRQSVEAPSLPKDEVELSASPAPSAAPSRSWIRRVAGWLGWGALGLTGAVAGVGALGYAANREALQQPPQVQLYLDQELFTPASPPTLSQQVAASPQSTIATSPQPGPPSLRGISLHVPRASLQNLSRQLAQSPRVQSLLQEQSRQLQSQLQQQIGKLQVQDQWILLDLEAPLPTSQQAFLHVGSVNLPSMGYRALQRESLPLAVQTSVQKAESHLQVEVTPLPPEGELDTPGALCLGGLRVRLQSPETVLSLQGQVQLHHDLGGKATRDQLERAQTPALREKLQARLAQGQRLQELLGPGQQNLSPWLDAALQEQKVDYRVELQNPKAGPLLEVDFQVWLVPDRDADGIAEVVLQPRLRHDASAELQVSLPQATPQGQAPSGWLAGKLHRQVQASFVQGLERGSQEATRTLRDQAGRLLAEQLQQQSGRVEKLLQQQLLQQRTLQATPWTGPFQVGLAGAQLQGQGLQLSLPGATPADLAEPGQISARISGQEMNQALRDRQDGGLVEWAPLLARARQQAGLKRLELDGGVPQLVLVRGEPALQVPLLLQPALGPSVRSTLTVPLRLASPEGALEIQPQLEQMKWENKQPGGLLDLLPPRVLNGLVSSSLQQAQLRWQVPQVQFQRAELLVPPGGVAPDLQLTFTPELSGR